MARKDWTVGLDADDTLWQNERFFRMSQARFAELLADHTEPDHLAQRLEAAERRNLARYGFGIKGFVLSMIETAVEVTEGRVPGETIRALLEQGHEMLAHPIDLLPGVAETVEALAGEAELVLITKGDLLDQERKLAQSGLGGHFDAVEIVSDKTPDIYARIFARHGRKRSIMVGNSLRSDILPALQAGAWAAHVPHELTWSYEAAEAPVDHRRFHRLNGLSDLPPLLDRL